MLRTLDHRLTAATYQQRLRQIVRRVKELLPSLDDMDRQTAVEVLAEVPPSLAD
jgi:hypothetical protein